MKYVFIGLSITSSWGNGHATTYRSLLKELSARGHQIAFLERDMPWYREHRDLTELPGVEIFLYHELGELERRHLGRVRDADAVIVGSYVPEGADVIRWTLRAARGITAFYDIDTPVTLAGLANGGIPYLTPSLVPSFDLYLSFTGGPTLERLERELGARAARPLYCSVDPSSYFPEARPARWALGYLGTYSPDRQASLTEFLVRPAQRLAAQRFVVAGPQYPDHLAWPENVERVAHVAPGSHRGFFAAQRFTLNVTRAEMLRVGYSPSVRLFEAAASGTPIISDNWAGLDSVLLPGEEILIARNARDVCGYLFDLSETERARIAARARARILAAHTAAHRAAELDRHVLEARAGGAAVSHLETGAAASARQGGA